MDVNQGDSILGNISYPQDIIKITTFLTDFKTKQQQQTPKYIKIINKINAPKKKTGSLKHIAPVVLVELDDIEKFYPDDPLLASIQGNTKRYYQLFCRAIDALVPQNQESLNDETPPVEVMIALRKQLVRDNNAGEDGEGGVNKETFPAALTRKYVLNFKPLSTAKPLAVRQVSPEMLGKFVTVKGMVTRVSNVKPLASVIALNCTRCGSEMFQEFPGQSLLPMVECKSEECKKNNSRGKLFPQTRGTKFLKFQEVKIQELTEQVPIGHIPRTMTVNLFENLARELNPGDIATISGIYTPVPYIGFQAMRNGLLTNTHLDALYITRMKEQYSKIAITPAIQRKIESLNDGAGSIYERLSKSIAPEIFGHDDIKKALLLQLVGGSTKTTHDGMKIRGDLNICLMGDPGVAKSQLLKHISKIAPRSVYTTGRGSSGVGLTASVMKDPVTDELVLEGGALVLADNGIACIDEFDKMDESDRTAIHEVMEQQSISVSKAGITTTLNARTSILAAANPLYGRYNTDRKATENINLPAALLSRFDLLFLILDKPSSANDLRLAKHVTFVHMHNHHPSLPEEIEVVDMELMKHYIAAARTFNPTVPKEVGEFMVQSYLTLRERVDETGDFQYTCARTLLSIIRISMALARLRFSELVSIEDVDEAMRLNDVSKASLLNDSATAKKKDPITAVYEIISQIARLPGGGYEPEIRYQSILERVKAKGLSEEDLKACIKEYEKNELWMLSGDGSKLRWLIVED